MFLHHYSKSITARSRKSEQNKRRDDVILDRRLADFVAEEHEYGTIETIETTIYSMSNTATPWAQKSKPFFCSRAPNRSDFDKNRVGWTVTIIVVKLFCIFVESLPETQKVTYAVQR
jgi:hypothetical protein